MANYIGRVIAGFSRTTNSEHYIIEMISQVTGEPYRHQIFVDNKENKAYHLIDGVDEMQDCRMPESVLSARYSVLRLALESIDSHWLDQQELYNIYRKLISLENKNRNVA